MTNLPHRDMEGADADETRSVAAAVASLYQIAVLDGKTTSTLRLRQLARYCVYELARRGIGGAEVETVLPGIGRPKDWDVGWKHRGKYRLAISLKSILSNPSGTVPNRLDDLMGEAANVQMYSPEIVIGYLAIYNVALDGAPRPSGQTWCDIFIDRLARLSRRKAPVWSAGMVESALVIKVDFSSQAKILTADEEICAFFDDLAMELRMRNPDLNVPA